MTISRLIPNNFALAKRFLTGVNPRTIFDLTKRNLSTDMFQESSDGPIVPSTIYLDSSYMCNRRCDGCYVANDSTIMPMELAESVCETGYKIGVAYIFWMGGEPFLANTKDLVLDVTSNFPNVTFSFCSNGDFIDEKIADKIANMPHISAVISLDGLERLNDQRRGNGAFKNATNAISLLHERKVLCGYSSTLLPGNWEEVTSKNFVESMIEIGSIFGTYTSKLCNGDGNIQLSTDQYNESIIRLTELSLEMPIYLFSTNIGYLGRNAFENGLKRLVGISISPKGVVKTNRNSENGKVIGKDGSLEEIIFSDEVQEIFRQKLNGTNECE
jgi:sulfatase maturation enzyme AslB (radical SAM superfamily)